MNLLHHLCAVGFRVDRPSLGFRQASLTCFQLPTEFVLANNGLLMHGPDCDGLLDQGLPHGSRIPDGPGLVSVWFHGIAAR